MHEQYLKFWWCLRLSYDYMPLAKPQAIMPVKPLHMEGEDHLDSALIHPSQLYVTSQDT